MIKQIKLINLSTWFFWHLYRQHGGFRKEERSKGPSSSLLTPTSSLKYSSLWPREAKESKSHIKNKIKWFFFFFFTVFSFVNDGFFGLFFSDFVVSIFICIVFFFLGLFRGRFSDLAIFLVSSTFSFCPRFSVAGFICSTCSSSWN